MPDKIMYYAVVDDLSSREQPAGVFRRTYYEAGGLRDEAFTRNLIWENSSTLVSAERGDLQNDFIEITEDEAKPAHGAAPRPVDRHEQRLAPVRQASPLECRPSWRDVALSR